MNRDLLVSKLNETGLVFSDKQIDAFMLYYDMLIEKNKVMNLTAITDFEEVIDKHFIDSISLCKIVDLKDQYLLDLGTGAGFPGIPLKIAFPDLKILLADSLNKRVLFLQDVIRKLDLKDIDAIHGRAEELGRNSLYREKFDLCVSRAVANLSTLSEYCLPFVKVGGAFVSYKSKTAMEELSAAKHAISLLGGQFKKDLHFELGDSDRTLLLIEKVSTTKKAYPRKAGTPSKDPL